MAHPDDAEFLCAGTLTLLRGDGFDVHIASMTAGDCGSQSLDKEAISRVRLEEARASAAKTHGQYYCLGSRDLVICYDAVTIRRVVELIREVDPELVITHSPQEIGRASCRERV